MRNIDKGTENDFGALHAVTAEKAFRSHAPALKSFCRRLLSHAAAIILVILTLALCRTLREVVLLSAVSPGEDLLNHSLSIGRIRL